MVPTLWYKLFSPGQSRVQRGDRRARVRQRRMQKPLLESLEERCLLSYQITDLGTLPGDDFSQAFGINASGQVVGESSSNFTGRSHAFLWDAVNGMQDLGTLGGPDSFAYGINDNGQVAGQSNGGPYHAFLWDATNGMQDLGTLPGGNFSAARRINNNGQVVGYSFPGDVAHAFLWDATNGMQDLGTLPGESDSIAFGINDSSQVVGGSYNPGSEHAFLWDATNGMQDLGTLPGDSRSTARSINNSGQVVGESSGTGRRRAFLWDAVHGMQDLGTLGRDTAAFSINSNGQVVGTSERFDPSFGDYVDDPFVWQDGTMSDLNDLIPPGSGWGLGIAWAINNAGQIVGGGFHSGHGLHAFLLTPDSSPLTAPAGMVHFTSSDPQAALLASSPVTAVDGVHPFSLTLATRGDQTFTVTATAGATRLGRATVAGTSDAAAPAGRTVHNAMFARSHRANASVSASDWEVTELELGVSLLPKL